MPKSEETTPLFARFLLKKKKKLLSFYFIDYYPIGKPNLFISKELLLKIIKIKNKKEARILNNLYIMSA
jgi:hypothetical protein